MKNYLPVAAALLALLSLAPVTASGQEIRSQPVARDGEVIEVYVDERGKIYRELRYHGIIPNVRDAFRGQKKQRKGRTKVTWVGFQPKQFYSRIFIQTTRLSRFVLHKPDPLHVVVKIDGASIPSRQTLRTIVTRAFSSSVEKIQARRRRGGAEITISLSKPVGYLYKQQGNYIFIDVER